MKKSIKTVLFAVGATAVSFLAYTVLKKREESVIQPREPVHEDGPSSASTAAQEFITHHQEVFQEQTFEHNVTPVVPTLSSQQPTVTDED